jgi:hypothetical protein
MDAPAYFSIVDQLQREYKDSLEVFRYDMIPGKNVLDRKVRLRSYTKAVAAFLFIRYDSPGKFMENIGDSSSIVVRLLPYKFEVIEAQSIDELTKKVKK